MLEVLKQVCVALAGEPGLDGGNVRKLLIKNVIIRGLWGGLDDLPVVLLGRCAFGFNLREFIGWNELAPLFRRNARISGI